MAEGKYCKIGGAIKQIVSEYCKIGGAIKQGTVNALKIGGVIKSISVGGVALFICEQVSDRLYAIDQDQANLDGWPEFGGTIADPKDVACDSSGNSYWACANNVYKMAFDGTITWTYTGHTVPVTAICVDADGNVYTGDSNGNVKKLNSAGAQVWTKQPHVGTVHALAVDYSAGQLYAAYGIGAAGRVYRFLTLNGNGGNVYYNAAANIFSIAIDEDTPSLYIGDNAGNLRKISTAGFVYWTVAVGGELYAVRVGHDGYGYYANGTGKKIGKFTLLTGATVWGGSIFTPAGTASAMSVAVDQFSKVYGSYKIGGSSIYNLVYKLTSAGAEDWNWNPYTTAQMYGLAVEPGIKAAGF